jgi:hypothetical protein
MQSTLTTLADTIVSEASPSETYVGRPTLSVRNVSDRRLLTFIEVRGLLDRDGAIVNAATLRLFPTEDFPTTTFHLRRPLDTWTPSTVRWSRMPDAGPTTTRTASGQRREPMDLDISNFVTAWLSDTPNRGIRIETTSTAAAGRSFYSMNASGTNAKYRPVVLLDVSYPPEAPDDIRPATGTISTPDPVLAWRYGGAGVEPMGAYQVQSNPNNVWTTPALDTGWVASGVPTHQLTGVPPEGVWVRIRHRSIDGRESPWSDPIRLDYDAPLTLTITSTDEETSDATPTTTWSVSGGEQSAFRVRLLNYSRAGEATVAADSGYMVGDDTQWTPSKPLTGWLDDYLVREVRIWDDVDRVPSPGVKTYVLAYTEPFLLLPTPVLEPVTELAVDTPLGPAVDVTWKGVTPDAYIVERRIRLETDPDDAGTWESFRVEVSDVAIGGGRFRWRDVTAPAHHVLAYRVRPVQNRSIGDAPYAVETVLRMQFIWLADPDDPEWLLAAAGQDAGEFTLPEQSAVVETRGGDRVHIIHEGFRGYEGSCNGELISHVEAMGLTSAQEQRNRILETKLSPTKVWRLALSDLNIPVILRNVNVVPQPDHELMYGASFEFYQQGELPWEQS